MLKRYVILSDAGSMHVYNFIRTVLTPTPFEIAIVAGIEREVPCKYDSYYREHGVRTEFSSSPPEKSATRRSILTRARRFRRRLSITRSLGRVAVLHVQYLDWQTCLLAILNRRRTETLILSFWGSDLFRASRSTRLFQWLAILLADVVTVTGERPRQVYIEKFGNCKSFRPQIMRLPCAGLGLIEEYRSVPRNTLLERMSLPTDRVIVTLGYNADPAQRQDELIYALESIDHRIAEEIHLVIPMQYARFDMEYISKVINAASRSAFSHTVLDMYSDQATMAELALNTSIFIHIRGTDAFSNSLKEQVYAGSTVIMGDWLHYPELEGRDLPIVKVGSLDEVAAQVSRLISSRPTQPDKRQLRFLAEGWGEVSVARAWHQFFLEKGIL